MYRSLVITATLLLSLHAQAQSCARADYPGEGDDGQSVSAEELGRRRADLRQMLKMQAQRVGPIDPRRLSFAERNQLRQQLLMQRQQALSQTP